MNGTKKRNIIIGSLCGVLLLMVVGYAAFQSVLKINGTTNISSDWDVRITNIEKTAGVGATDKEAPTYDNTKGLSATFNTNLTSPGDYATYKITITNNGSLDAVLKTITIPENTNNDILFYLNKDQNNADIAGALKQNDTLSKSTESNNVGYVYVTVLYKDYANQQTATTKTASMTISFDFEQATTEGGGIIIGPSEGDETAADKLINTAVTSGNGLYADTYEPGRYVYKGANPNNYITFNNETWRIISVETDGTLKIVKKDSIGNKAWDGANSSDWARPATLNTYLNDGTKGATSYYNNSLSADAKNLIQEHTWGIGSVTNDNTDLAGQITSENGTTWSGKIGLISVSDYLRANLNTKDCGNYSLNNTNKEICKPTNYLVPTSGFIWTISFKPGHAFFVGSSGIVNSYYPRDNTKIVVPALYLIPNITLNGEGTSDIPYTITVI